MKYKLLAIDIDDTLTKEGLRVPEENVRAIKKAQDAGVFVTVSTGRSAYGAKEIYRQLGIKGPIIVYGGAIIHDTVKDEPIHSAYLSSDMVHELLALAKELNIHANIYQNNTVIYAKENDYGIKYRTKLNLPYIIDDKMHEKTWENTPKVLFITEQERVDELLDDLIEKYRGRVKVSGSQSGFIEFNNPWAHKGSGLEWVCNYLGIKQEETVAIGDNLLDYEMIQWAKVGAAVSDANKAVLNIADVVTPSCEENGVAWLIENVVLKG